MPKIILEPYAGENIFDVCKFAFYMAGVYGKQVNFTFNDIPVVVNHDDPNAQAAIDRWFSISQTRQEEALAKQWHGAGVQL